MGKEREETNGRGGEERRGEERGGEERRGEGRRGEGRGGEERRRDNDKYLQNKQLFGSSFCLLEFPDIRLILDPQFCGLSGTQWLM